MTNRTYLIINATTFTVGIAGVIWPFACDFPFGVAFLISIFTGLAIGFGACGLWWDYKDYRSLRKAKKEFDRLTKRGSGHET